MAVVVEESVDLGSEEAAEDERLTIVLAPLVHCPLTQTRYVRTVSLSGGQVEMGKDVLCVR